LYKYVFESVEVVNVLKIDRRSPDVVVLTESYRFVDDIRNVTRDIEFDSVILFARFKTPKRSGETNGLVFLVV
jgi:hypothetical protein